MAAACADGGGIAWIGLYRPTREEFAAVTRRLRPARARRRGRRQGAPAAQARALRRHAVLRAAPGPLRRRDRDGRVRRGPRLRGPALRHHRPPRRGARPGAVRRGPGGAAPICCGSGPWRSCTRSWTTSSTTTCRWSPASRTTSTRSRTRSSAASARRVAADLRAHARGDRLPAGRRSRSSDARPAHRRAPGVDEEEPATCATCRTTRCASTSRSTGSASCSQNILSVNLTLETEGAERGLDRQNEEVKKISAWAAILFAPVDRGHGLRHELRAHAGARMDVRLSVRARAHGRDRPRALRRLQAPRRWI